MSNNRSGRWILAAALLIAAGPRVAACATWFEDLSLDPDGYGGLAARLIEGAGYVTPDGRPTAFRPPFYPWLLAGVIGAGPLGIAALHVATGVATVGLTVATGRRLGLGLGALIAAGVVAVDPLLLRYTAKVMTEVTCAFLAASLLWCLADGRRPLLAGVVFGLAVLARPTFWAFGLLMALAWLWDRVARERGAPVRWLRPIENMRITGMMPQVRHAALVLLGTMLVMTPWALRNTFAIGRPVVTTTHGGYTLLLANNPVFWREVIAGPSGSTWGKGSLARWQQSLERRMSNDNVQVNDEVARDRWMKMQAIENARNQPGPFLQSILYRLRRLWDVSPLGPAAEGTPIAVRWGVAVFYFVVHVAAVAGVLQCLHAWRAERLSPPVSPWNGADNAPGLSPPARPESKNGSWRPAFLLIASFTIVHALYWTDTRMRAPLVPAIALCAARGMTNVPFRRLFRHNRGDS